MVSATRSAPTCGMLTQLGARPTVLDKAVLGTGQRDLQSYGPPRAITRRQCVRSDWGLREIHPELRARYRAEGHWDGRTLGQMAAQALAPQADLSFTVHSAFRPYQGTLGELDRRARALATSLAARGVGPGSTVVM